MAPVRNPQGEGNEGVRTTVAGLPVLHHRFVRLNPRFDKEETLRLLQVGSLAASR
jgi:hypothetical protein